MYKTPLRTSSAPSPIRNILASQFIAATHNRTGIQADGGRIVPSSGDHRRRQVFDLSGSNWLAGPPDKAHRFSITAPDPSAFIGD